MDAETKARILSAIQASPDPGEEIQELRRLLSTVSPYASQPVDFVRWVPIEQVEPNSYNPNAVAKIEMGLLLTSIEHDGYTQPVVTYYDQERDKYIIVDGFHRYWVMRSNEEIARRTSGRLPCVVIEKTLNERMASTIRHNRARGKHRVAGMSELVFKMLEGGMTDEQICNELGMEPEELLRLKHITGFSALFADRDYNRAWVSKSQIEIEQAYRRREAEKQDTTRE